MSEDIRGFIAISLDTKIKRIIGQIQEELSTLDLPLRWVKPEITHITLKFLGSVPSKRMELLTATIRESVSQRSIFSFSLSHIGAFPNARRPNVVWLGIENPADDIKILAEGLENDLGHIGFKKEDRSFHSHITIGRMKEGKGNTSLAAVMEKHVLPENYTQTCDHVTLFKSTLHPCGPQYDILEEFKLKP